MAVICKKCLVELDDNMNRCPLCDTLVNGSGEDMRKSDTEYASDDTYAGDEEKHLLQRVIWQITATVLLSGIAATIVVDYANERAITWSIYPVTMSFILLSYAALFAFWQSKSLYRILAGWILSTLLLYAVGELTPRADWAVRIGIPLLVALNALTLALLALARVTKRKGLNLLSYIIVATAVLCICIEGIISNYQAGAIQLEWSVIVAACLLPVAIALFFMYLRTRNNPKLQKIFHT